MVDFSDLDLIVEEVFLEVIVPPEVEQLFSMPIFK